ncbi:post-GPI attachment to proteins factor 4-like [Antedon mediterranea]|uniref:post-GPI attachment to proteins factor 4-like n=1 Tax=Antedon mediterranea TaxID=105859 RepID=UPI003AF98EF0
MTFYLILPNVLRDYPYSSYFAPKWNIYRKAVDLNEDRIQVAEDYLRSVNAAKSRQMYSQKTPAKYVIGIITVQRFSYDRNTPQPKYLTQVVARLHNLIAKSSSQSDYQLFVCNVDSQGSRHDEAIHLSNYVRMVSKNENGNSRNNWNTNRWEREKLDYIYCLEQAWLYDSKYVLLLQDDGLPHFNFIEVLEYLVSDHLENRIQGGDMRPNLEKWAWLKLTFPENLAGFTRNWRFVLEWICISLILASVNTLLALCCYRYTLISLSFFYIIFIVSFCFYLNFTWAIGRPMFVNFGYENKHSYSLKPATSCCLPAVLYPSKNVRDILNYLENVRCNNDLPIDFVLPNYAEKSGLKEYLASPNLFTHIGMFSSLRQRNDPRTAWAYLREI